jgi:hypothetical protein
MCDAGYGVNFDKDKARVTRNGELVHTFSREGGLYVAEMHIGGEPEPPATNFGRQGQKA